MEKSKEKVICPNCQQYTELRLSEVDYALAPTGGDYDWVETNAKNTCSHCGDVHSLRVQIDLETGIVGQVMKCPKPYHDKAIWYAWGTYYASSFSKGMFSISVSPRKLFLTKQEALQNNLHGKKLLKVTKDGFFDDNDRLLPEEDFAKPTISFSLY